MNDNPSQLDKLLEAARKAARARKHAEVIAECKKALAIDPEDIRFVFMLGTALQRIGKFEEAEPLLKRVIVAAPGLAAAHQDLGLAYLSRRPRRRNHRFHRITQTQEPIDVMFKFISSALLPRHRR